MSFPWHGEPSSLQPPTGYSYYPQARSAQSSPYAQPAVLLPTPPVAVSPLPGGPVWLPVYSPGNTAVPLPSPGAQHRQLHHSEPVVIDILHPSTRRTGAKQPHLIYDLRDFPEKAFVNIRPQPAPLSEAHLDAPITSPPTTQIKVISKAFPWEVDVESAADDLPVTVGDLINAVHECLQKHISGSEWWIVTDQQREKVSAQYVKNCDRSSAGNPRRFEVEKPREKSEGLRRVDWLLDNIVMMGLEKDETYIAQRFRDRETRASTWVLVTGPKR